VRIAWTDGGIPHLDATSAEDLFFAQGYLTAAERLFQMDLLRRTARGELAEILGERESPWRHVTSLPPVEVDYFLRQLALAPSARSAIETLSPSRRGLVESYAAGVNAWEVEGARPLECQLLGYRPRPWTAVDSELVWKLLSLQLSAGLHAGLVVEALRARFPADPEKVRAFLPEGAETFESGSSPWSGADALLSRVELLVGPASPVAVGLGGSSGWAIAAARTREGRPILCGDLHLPFRIPAPGYLIHLAGAGFDVAGWSIPGVPGVVLGHNARLAWTLTSSRGVVAGWAQEQLSTDGEQVRVAGGFAPIESELTEIVVRGARVPVRRTLRHTANGPLFDQRLTGSGETDRGLALRWTGHLPTPDLEVVFDLDLARDFESFRNAGSRLGAPQLNAICADVDGHIGLQLLGIAPRFRGRPPAGAVPGWSAEHEWEGIEPFETLPTVRDPDSGTIVSANQQALPPGARPRLGMLFDPPWRARRIQQRLDAEPALSLAGVTAMQHDRFSGFGVELRDRVLGRLAPRLRGAYPPLTSGAELVLAASLEWNGFSVPGSAGAAAVAAFTRAMAHELFARALGEPLLRSVLSQQAPALVSLLRVLEQDGAPFCVQGEIEDICRRALSAAADELGRRCGPDVRRWRLDALRRVTMQHPLTGMPGLGSLADAGVFPWAGDASTVSWAGVRLAGDGQAVAGPVFRHSVACGEWDSYRIAFAGGQSGDPASGRFTDLLARWREASYLVLPFSEDAVRRAAKLTAVLSPRVR
jgi:penicillin amidase